MRNTARDQCPCRRTLPAATNLVIALSMSVFGESTSDCPCESHKRKSVSLTLVAASLFCLIGLQSTEYHEAGTRPSKQTPTPSDHLLNFCRSLPVAIADASSRSPQASRTMADENDAQNRIVGQFPAADHAREARSTPAAKPFDATVRAPLVSSTP